MMSFDPQQYKVYTWKNWMVLHWILNPGMAVNELVLGQRVPKISLEDRTSDKPRFERSLVPCPHCQTLHDGRTWSTETGTAFRNWFGLYCPDCGGIIPCLTNVTSALILILSYPLWGWFRNRWKAQWLARQPKRFQQAPPEKVANPFSAHNWIKTGLAWAAVMFVLMTLIIPYVNEQKIDLRHILVGLVVWTLGGLAFGYVMKLFLNKSGTQKPKSTPS